MDLTPISDRIPMDKVARRIHAVSNFRFAWQTFVYDEPQAEAGNAAFVREAIASLAAHAHNHAFLHEHPSARERPEFFIEPLDEAVVVRKAGDALAVALASASTHRLGEDVRVEGKPDRWDVVRVRKTFQQAGEYEAFEVVLDPKGPNTFTNWYDGRRGDRCYVAVWPKPHWIWVGCLLDTQ